MYMTSVTSGEQTASALIITGPCFLSGIQVVAEGADAKIVVQDGVTAAGTVKCEMTIVNANKYGGRNWTAPIKFTTGIYVTLTGADASYFVEILSP